MLNSFIANIDNSRIEKDSLSQPEAQRSAMKKEIRFLYLPFVL